MPGNEKDPLTSNRFGAVEVGMTFPCNEVEEEDEIVDGTRPKRPTISK